MYVNILCLNDRFFGRIADSPDSHDKPTLEAIRANMHGLAGKGLNSLTFIASNLHTGVGYKLTG